MDFTFLNVIFEFPVRAYLVVCGYKNGYVGLFVQHLLPLMNP